MINITEDINDDELRVIGKNHAQPIGNKKKPWRKYVWPCVIVAVVLTGILMLIFLLAGPEKDESDALQQELEAAMYDPMPEGRLQTEMEPVKPLGHYEKDETLSYTEVLHDSINDVSIDIYIPHNAVPKLVMGVPDMNDRSIILATQAADIRADNGKIVGAFVVDGKPLSWGLSKKGYCGIIDGKMTVGVADNSPLFEEATEKGGYFFRQYPLVNNGVLVENELKNKSIRKALCDRNGEYMVVMTNNPESLHDFAQVLVDMRVDNAIYLVGSTSYGCYVNKSGKYVPIYQKVRGGQKNENFVVWQR